MSCQTHLNYLFIDLVEQDELGKKDLPFLFTLTSKLELSGSLSKMLDANLMRYGCFFKIFLEGSFIITMYQTLSIMCMLNNIVGYLLENCTGCWDNVITYFWFKAKKYLVKVLSCCEIFKYNHVFFFGLSAS